MGEIAVEAVKPHFAHQNLFNQDFFELQVCGILPSP